jgi:hypothetical protein
MIRAAREAGMRVIWDLCHYGWPDDLDIWSAEFVSRFAAFARAFAELMARETDATPFYTPMNEISFFAWAGGDVAYINPFCARRGPKLKTQLVRATLAAVDAIWSVSPHARIVYPEPLIHIVSNPKLPQDDAAVAAYVQAQFQAWDMICGRIEPQLGGHPKYLDIIGINYYHNNQWIHKRRPFNRFHPQYRWLSQMLREVYERYRRPLFIAETGCEDEMRPEWLRYIGREVRHAIRDGAPVEGICLYPILNHPGWDNDRHCHNGLFDYHNHAGEREVYAPLAAELHIQQARFGDAPMAPAQRHDQQTLCLHTDSLEPADIGEVMLTLAAELRGDFRLLFACPSSPAGKRLLKRAAALGAETHGLPARSDRSMLYALRKWLRAHNVAIFHTHAASNETGFASVQIAHGLGIPAVVRTERLPYMLADPGQRLEHARMVQALDALVCVGEEARQSFLAAGVPEHLLTVVHEMTWNAAGQAQQEFSATRMARDMVAVYDQVLQPLNWRRERAVGHAEAGAGAPLRATQSARTAFPS